ncbi:MAG: hypothetical protein VX964_06210 [Verrucomicrobiota bacterium]|nr:hypothetical protein [Verrucomicrobiota bacterium]
MYYITADSGLPIGEREQAAARYAQAGLPSLSVATQKPCDVLRAVTI